MFFHTFNMSRLISKNDFRDNCGFGLVANINGVKSHKVVINSIDALRSMTHRGGVGSDGKTGDGCGLLIDIDHNWGKRFPNVRERYPEHDSVNAISII